MMFNGHFQYVLGNVDEAYLTGIVDDLDGMHPSVSTAPGGRVTVRVTFLAENQRVAYLTAFDRVTAAVNGVWRLPTRIGPGAMPEYAEVMTEAEFNLREGWDDIPDLISVPDAAELLGVSRQRMSQLIDGGRFASVQRVGERTVVLSRAEVEKYRTGPVNAGETRPQVGDILT